MNFFIRNDLTSRRHALYKKAVELLPDQKGTFAFADVNSNLVIRHKGNLYHFNTEQELLEIVARV